MPLVTDCPYCQHTSRLRETFVGKKVRCPKCKGVFLVTDPADETGSPPEPAHTYYDMDEPRRMSPAVIAFGISGALLATSAFILLVWAAQQPRKLQTRPAASDWATQQPSAASGLARDVADVAVGGMALMLLFVMVALFILHIALLIWVAVDARNRGDGNAVVWMLVVLFLGLIGLIIYILARRPGELVTCDNCHNRRIGYTTSCPHCGVKTA